MRTKANPHVISDQDVIDIKQVLADAMESYSNVVELPDHAVRVADMISYLETQAKSVTMVKTDEGTRICVDMGPDGEVPIGNGITKAQILKARVADEAGSPFHFETHLQNVAKSGKFD